MTCLLKEPRVLRGKRVHFHNRRPVGIGESQCMKQSCLSDVPYFVPELCELRLVGGIEAVLRLGFDEDAYLKSPATEHDARPYVWILVHHSFCS